MIDELPNNMTGQTADDQELASVLERYLLSLESNAPLDIEELAAAHPELAADIRSFATCVETLHHATQGFGASSENDLAGGVANTTKGSNRVVAKRLGDFEIGPEIGRGGMGIVYEGQQISLQRKVALKVLPFAAMWDQKQVARFRNEARAAAQLHHPNIVPVFAVGEERGVHFYAMQFIAGRSLDLIISETRREAVRPLESTVSSIRTVPVVPSTIVAQTTQQSIVAQSNLSSQHAEKHNDYCRAIARLGIQAAKALEYAHECGVIHRDIKPSNLLVDDTNKLWITDFGLALVQDSPSVTMTGDIVGTLRYMSPEQANGKHPLVDARTDVYSLGASLYELLTLQPAFPGDDRQAVLKAVAECEPKSPRAINSEIPLDLETIVLQAMSKSRDDRYTSAGALAEDLTRFLEGKPTHARRPTVADRTGKWFRRHRVVASLAALFLVVLTLVSTTGAVLISRAQSRTQAALEVAELNLRHARQVVDRFGSQFSQELARLPGSEPLRQEVLSDTLADYQEFIARSAANSTLKGDPTLKKELATTHFQAGSIASRLGNQAAAEKSFRSAADMFEELANESIPPTKYQQSRATCLNNLALLFASQGNLVQARKAYATAIELQTEVAAAGNKDVSSLRLLAEMLTNRGLLERQSGESVAARKSLTRAIGLLNKIHDQHPGDLQAVRGLALALNNRSFIEQETDWQLARESCEAALVIFRQLADNEQLETPTLAGRRSDLALCYNNLGSILGHLQRDKESVAAYRQAVEIQKQLVRQSPGVVQYRSELAITWNNLGQVLARSNVLSESTSSYDRSEELFSQLAIDYPKEMRFRSSLAGVLNNRAMAEELAGDLSEALANYEAAIDQQLAAIEQSPRQTQYREYLSKHYFNYGRALRAAGKPVEAARVAIARRKLWPSHGEQHLDTIQTKVARGAL